jgi:hypothetical protein
VAKTPIISDAAMSITIIQMLSWTAGQWYLWTRAERRSKTREPEAVVPVTVEAISRFVVVGNVPSSGEGKWKYKSTTRRCGRLLVV